MELLDFIHTVPNWEACLRNPPYNLKVVWDGDYVLLKYDQLASDLSLAIVQESRGCIFYAPYKNHECVQLVCYPFDKFFNYGEANAARIDWATARVQEKIDGSLIKLFYYNDEWHVATNGTIDAKKAETAIRGVSFYDVFIKALSKRGSPEYFFSTLNTNYTYLFELVSPITRVVIEYPDYDVYFLGSRDMTTLYERKIPSVLSADFFTFVKLPQTYPLNTLEDCIKVAKSFDKNQEGFVVCDNSFNRIKIKSPEYLVAAKLHNNGALTVKRVIKAMRAGVVDDFYSYDINRAFVESVVETYKKLSLLLDNCYSLVLMKEEEIGEQAYKVILSFVPKQYQDYCFKRKEQKVRSAYEYLENMPLNILVDWIEGAQKDESL